MLIKKQDAIRPYIYHLIMFFSQIILNFVKRIGINMKTIICYSMLVGGKLHLSRYSTNNRKESEYDRDYYLYAFKSSIGSI